MDINSMLKSCSLCPRKCHADRYKGHGLCGGGQRARLALVSLHPWEEPVIAGEKGAGTVFFSGCSLKCVYCQNHEISHYNGGIEVSEQRLGEIFLEQQARGASVLELVTPSHYIIPIIEGLIFAKKKGFCLPVVYNTSGYESLSALELIKDYVDVFMPDLKYFSPDASERYSGARDYFDVASEALRRMFELAGPLVEKDGILQRGMIVRHLVLPGLRKDSMKLIDWLWSEFGDDIYLSLMNQYTPMHRSADYPEINRRLTTFEYDSVVNYAYDAGFRKSFIQDRRAASEEYVPDWTGDGVENY